MVILCQCLGVMGDAWTL